MLFKTCSLLVILTAVYLWPDLPESAGYSMRLKGTCFRPPDTIHSRGARQKPLGLLKPKGGETFHSTDTVHIVWEYDPAIVGFVRIFISIDSGKAWREITDIHTKPAQPEYAFSMDAVRRKTDSLPWVPASATFNLLNKGLLIMIRDYSGGYTDRSEFFTILKQDGIVLKKATSLQKINIIISRHAIDFSDLGGKNTLEISIYSFSGRLQKKAIVPPYRSTYRCSIGDLSAGFYVLKVTDRDNEFGGGIIFSKLQ